MGRFSNQIRILALIAALALVHGCKERDQLEKEAPALARADQNLRLPRRNQRANPVGKSDSMQNTAPPSIISPPAIIPPIAWLSAGEKPRS